MVVLALLGIILLSGCMTFTDRDYELQDQAYQRQREQEKLKPTEGTMHIPW
ncbi:MAG: hypothetical protein WC676_03985 [Candidatus Omnitrophota bacterium]